MNTSETTNERAAPETAALGGSELSEELGAWLPIETAPEDQIVFVGWYDDQGTERYEIDHKEDGCWYKHEEAVQFADSVAPRDMDIPCKMPSVEAPYTHWMRANGVPRASNAHGKRHADTQTTENET